MVISGLEVNKALVSSRIAPFSGSIGVVSLRSEISWPHESERRAVAAGAL